MPCCHSLKNLNPAERLRTAESLLPATWNIREFGDNRSQESLFFPAETISRFDLVALQEVSASLGGLEKLMKLLNPQWDYIAADSTEGSAGGGERMVFLYDRRKITFRKMAGEIVLPPDKLIDGQLQFARTPYSVAFQAGWFKFVLTSVHIYYGSNSAADRLKREREIDTITSVLSKRAGKEDTDYILLGDFNIPGTEDGTVKALEKYGFTVPQATGEHPSDLGGAKHYDRIAFNLKPEENMTVFSEKEQKAGAFSFAETVYTERDLETYREYFPDRIKEKTEREIKKYYLSTWRTFQMSDHLPLWVELKIDFGNRHLEKIRDLTD